MYGITASAVIYLDRKNTKIIFVDSNFIDISIPRLIPIIMNIVEMADQFSFSILFHNERLNCYYIYNNYASIKYVSERYVS